MKCIQCGVDNNLKDRTAHRGQCKSCGHRFAFEPTAMRAPLKFTDGFFAKLIDDLSLNGTLYFTEEQLYQLFVRRMERKAIQNSSILQGCGCLLLFFSLPGLVVGFGVLTIPVGLVLVAWGWWQKRRKLRQQPKTFEVSRAQFQEFLQTWQQANGAPEQLLPPVSAAPTAAPVQVSPEISDYSFDRVVICQHDRIAQLLIANNLHFEHSCAVLSLGGYPAGVFDSVMAMLRRNPNLSVYALHDASPAGVRMTTALRLPKWFPDAEIAIYDLGLLPRQVMAMPNPFVRATTASAQQAQRLPDSVRQSLSPEELAWLLQGNYLGLELFSPQRLLQVVSQGINRSRLEVAADSELDDASSWSSDSTASGLFFLADGFG